MTETMQADTFDVGKLPMQFLQTMLGRYGGEDERMVVGPRVGEDAVVLDMGDRYLVASDHCHLTTPLGWITESNIEPLFVGQFPPALTTTTPESEG